MAATRSTLKSGRKISRNTTMNTISSGKALKKPLHGTISTPNMKKGKKSPVHYDSDESPSR